MFLNPEPEEQPVFEALWVKGLPMVVKRFEDPRPKHARESAGQLWTVNVGLRPVSQTDMESVIPGAHRVLSTGAKSVAPTYISVKPVQCETWSREAMAGTGRQHRHSPSCQVTPIQSYAPSAGWWTKREFDFADPIDGLLAAMRWDPETEPEPHGWIREGHRIRPEGDPMSEFVVVERERTGPESPDPNEPKFGNNGWLVECSTCIWTGQYLNRELAVNALNDHHAFTCPSTASGTTTYSAGVHAHGGDGLVDNLREPRAVHEIIAEHTRLLAEQQAKEADQKIYDLIKASIHPAQPGYTPLDNVTLDNVTDSLRKSGYNVLAGIDVARAPQPGDIATLQTMPDGTMRIVNISPPIAGDE
jgi:hypothetical protein